ncbi:E3 ubiquitin-protein ligase ZFP91 [Channa argus]|uniref:E3 ubiquitin-protein ligase ZFP91 n=1 Tax=Channa argus TaxID=215402 RepID=A0A6G1Q6S0_CHAAH|nr:E3 ubiquitin-protein ligase ZFP91 [Channa argus]
MNLEKHRVLDTRTRTATSGNPPEASKPSLDSNESCSSVRGSKRRGKRAVTPPCSDLCPSGTGSSLRVLRARGVASGTTDAKNAHRERRSGSRRRTRRTYAGSFSRNTPAMQNAIKKSTTKQGEETGAVKGTNHKEKSLRRRLTSQQKEVKKEESEKKEEDQIKEESTEDVGHNEDKVGDDTEQPSRKRWRQKDGKAPRQPKRRKKPPVQYVRCDIEGCGTVLAHPRYLQHHIKYQHLLKKKYVCEHPSCGRLFRLQKQLLRHAKHHTDQRDYICEYCARAFKSSHNLAVHRMIHTGEKPIQCEICGFTCRQKASLNWHMKKHDAEASYKFSCSICGKKFEKKDSVIAHKAKSHPEVLIAEAIAANGGSVITSPTPVSGSAPVLTQPDQPTVSQEKQEAVGDILTPLQQVVLPLTPQTPVDVAQCQFLELPMHHVVEVGHQPQAPAVLHLTALSPAHISGISQPQVIQIPSIPASTVASMTTVDSQSSLLSLSSVTTLAPQQSLQWSREGDEVPQVPGEGDLWDRVIVGGRCEDVGEIMWEGNREIRKGDEGVIWEREGDRQIVLQCNKAHGDSLM